MNTKRETLRVWLRLVRSEQVEAMRAWLRDITWSNSEDEELRTCCELDVLWNVERGYCGGIAAFVADDMSIVR